MLISPDFNFDDFRDRVKNLRYQQIITTAQDEIAAIGTRLSPAARNAGASKYKSLLGGLIWLLEKGTKPNSVEWWDFPKLRPIIESLVASGDLGPQALDVFDKDST